MSIIDNNIWVEKYRPHTLNDCILPNRIKDQLREMITNNNIINYSAVGSSGSGKTSSIRAICEELGIDYLLINMSNENGIDTVRNKIVGFASTMSFTSNYKVIILDEFDYANCLGENQSVLVGTVDNYKYVRLNELDADKQYPIVSYNMNNGKYENDTGIIIKDSVSNDMYSIIFDNPNETGLSTSFHDGKYTNINCTGDHPFICEGNIEKTISDGLEVGDKVISLNNELSVITSIERLCPQRVINLNVEKNHTFITDGGIVTHNCNSTQPALRGVIEQFQENCRFVITANYKSKIIEAIYSRCPIVDFNFSNDEKKEMLKQFISRIKFILAENNIDYDNKELINLCVNKFPDFRGTITNIQSSIRGDELYLNSLGSSSSKKIEELITLLKKQDFNLIRKWVVDNATSNDGHIVRRSLYNSMKDHVKDSSIPTMVMTINEYDYKESHVIDREVNMVAFLCALMAEVEFK